MQDSITVLSGSRSEWLLALPYSDNGSQGDAFRNHGGHQIECNFRTPEDSKRSFPPVIPTMAQSMEQVCMCVCARARVLLWRWLDKRCHMSYHYSAILHFRELFDCPSYLMNSADIINYILVVFKCGVHTLWEGHRSAEKDGKGKKTIVLCMPLTCAWTSFHKWMNFCMFLLGNSPYEEFSYLPAYEDGTDRVFRNVGI
jgi:hypothetical protein